MTHFFQAFTARLHKAPKSTYCLLLILLVSLFLHIVCMASTNLLVEEAYYWNYAQHLDFSYLDHPPMVAVLIKLSTSLFGNNELSVRLNSLICWFLTAFFSYRLTLLIHRNAGIYAVMLLTVLPFFALQTLVITPDLPLILCWSASLYYLYRALVLEESHCWYLAGLSLGLGMLSKYTIVLLGLATLFYLVRIPSARFWFRRKEPYLCALLVALLFTPVIYWNATHHWVSFLFQSQRRFTSTSAIDLHYLLGLVCIFITPIGVLGLAELFKKDSLTRINNTGKTQSFMRIFILVPLVFFALFSLNHEINLNWIGPLFLALIPWLATLIAQNSKKRMIWLGTALSLLTCYTSVALLARFNTSDKIQEKLFIKVVAWESLIKKFHQVAERIETKTHSAPIFIPLDNFPIGSELAFYQAKFLQEGTIQSSYAVVGAHIFGLESLMYRYWSQDATLNGKTLILISKELWRFDMPDINTLSSEQSPLKKMWSYGQGQGVRNIPFYYKIIKMKA